MAILTLALPTIFLHEGGYVNNPKDPGGATNYGISLRFLLKVGDLDKDGWPDGDIDRDGDTDEADIRAMDPEKASYFYDVCFWTKYKYGLITNQTIATKLFDLSVNMGGVGAHKCIQRAIRAATGQHLDDDGILGEKSFQAINDASYITLLPALKSEAAGYYRSIRPKSNKDFLTGWLNRAYANVVSGRDPT